MAEYVLFGDLHLSDRPPSSCSVDYLEDMFALLDQVGEVARQRSARAVICAGDFFHHKTPGRTSHHTVRRSIEVLQSFSCPVYVVPGNHDMSNDRLSSLGETQPLGVVFSSGAAQILQGWMLGIDGQSDPVFGVPWLMSFTDGQVSQALADYRVSLSESEPSLVVAHAPLYPPGQELSYEHYPTLTWAEFMGEQGSVYYGHVHEAHGVYEVGGVTFCNPGALSRGSLHEHNLTREISVAVWDSVTGEFEIVGVPHKSAAEVFRLVEVGVVKDAQERLDDFLTSVGETRIEITSIESVLAHIRALDLGAEVEALVEELLVEVSS